MVKDKHKNKSNSTGTKWVLGVIVLAAIGLTVWRVWIYTPASKVIVSVGNTATSSQSPATSSSATAPKAPSSTTKTNDGNTDSTTKTIGGSIDTKGQTDTTTPSSQWTTSASGLITVQQPVANASLASGAVLNGTAKVGAVNYTLIDDSVGVISQGTLTVNDGKFSGNVVFSTHSTSGRIDVFSTNSQGAEINEVQIAVRF